MSYPEHYEWEPPDPPTDESVKVRCRNPACIMYGDPDGYWHPTTFSEYQGVRPHGGPVDFYTDDAFTCPECGREGEEVG